MRIPFSEHLLALELFYLILPMITKKQIPSALFTCDESGVQGAFIHPCFSKTISLIMCCTTFVLLKVASMVLQCALWVSMQDEVSGAGTVFGDIVGGFRCFEGN